MEIDAIIKEQKEKISNWIKINFEIGSNKRIKKNSAWSSYKYELSEKEIKAVNLELFTGIIKLLEFEIKTINTVDYIIGFSNKEVPPYLKKIKEIFCDMDEIEKEIEEEDKKALEIKNPNEEEKKYK